MEMPKFSKKNIPSLIKYFLFLNLGILMLAVGIYFFKSTNGFATGGVSGIAIVLAEALKDIVPIKQSVYTLVINVILLIIGVIILGKKCGALTFYCSLMFSFENWIFEMLIPLEHPLTYYTCSHHLICPEHNGVPCTCLDSLKTAVECTGHSEMLIELVFAVMLTGIGSAIVFKCNASSGGTDIVALIIKKYTNMDVGKALLVSDLAIALSTAFVFRDIRITLFSLLGLFAKVFVLDDILDSMNLCKAFTIITTKADEIDEYIMNELRHSATVQRAEGAYSHEEKTVIMTVCRRSEALKLRRKVKEIDPHAFIIITKTTEIMGKGFRDN